MAKNTSSWWAGLKLDKFVENKVFRARKAFLANNPHFRNNQRVHAAMLGCFGNVALVVGCCCYFFVVALIGCWTRTSFARQPLARRLGQKGSRETPGWFSHLVEATWCVAHLRGLPHRSREASKSRRSKRLNRQSRWVWGVVFVAFMYHTTTSHPTSADYNNHFANNGIES